MDICRQTIYPKDECIPIPWQVARRDYRLAQRGQTHQEQCPGQSYYYSMHW